MPSITEAMPAGYHAAVFGMACTYTTKDAQPLSSDEDLADRDPGVGILRQASPIREV